MPETAERPDDPHADLWSPQTQMALALGRLNEPVYGGTVPHAEIARRRKANRVARASRKTNRGLR